ncbi:hypothetical protein [Lacrimispora sp. 38-1]|uniref:hypothetical protein n=1 Tax=Lacrimispora sp. 38-1 TaxID=3125778 RepID=UPI003CE75E08
MTEKINYAWPVTSENASVYNYFLKKIENIKGLLSDKRIGIFGSGIRGCCILKILEMNGFKNIIFIDNNTEKQNNLINDYDIVSFEEALNYKQEQVFLVSPEGCNKIHDQLREAGLQENKEWFSFSVSAYDSYIEEYKRPLQDYLLVMGDCAFTHIALDDSNFDSLGTMIRNKAGEASCKVLDMHGMGQQAYYHIAHSLIECNQKPSAFLLLLMIETMAPKVPIMPRTQHPWLIKSLSDISNNREFSEYAKLTQERFERFQVEAFSSFDNKIGKDTEKEKLYMNINYLFKFRETTEGVVYLKKTIRMMNEENIPVILYIPPVNYFQGERLFGADFKQKYETNFIKLYETLEKDNLKYEVVDASYLLELEDFAAPNTIDETCNYNGRLKSIQYLSKFAPLNRY